MDLSFDEKLGIVREKLNSSYYANKDGLVELDFEFNLLSTAAQSYKHETVLKPFPKYFDDSHSELVCSLKFSKVGPYTPTYGSWIEKAKTTSQKSISFPSSVKKK
jgi:hypothetical protein